LHLDGSPHVIRLRRSLYGTSMPGAGAVHHIKAGHPVLFSSRHPDELKHLVAGLGFLAQAGTVSQAIGFGNVLLIAVPYHALPQVGQDYVDSLRNKIVLDACNAVAARDGPDIADEAEQNGIGITSQKYLPGTRLVRAFNTLNYKCRLENSEQAYWPLVQTACRI